MKSLVLIFFLLISQLTFGFDYQSYVKNFIDSVENTQVGNGVCVELIVNMMNPIKDSMLIDMNRQSWGEPINTEDAQIGDILIYANHIVIVYSNVNGVLKIADQNRTTNGVNEKIVKIHTVNNMYKDLKNFQVYHPIKLEDVKEYQNGETKKTCLSLFVVNTLDKEKMVKSSYNNKKVLKSNIIDTQYNYSDLELDFARYFDGKVRNHKIETPNGIILVKLNSWLEFVPVKYCE